MKLYNRNFSVGERIEYMGWVNEGVINNNISWQSYKPRFLVLKGTEVMLFDSPPVSFFVFFYIFCISEPYDLIIDFQCILDYIISDII